MTFAAAKTSFSKYGTTVGDLINFVLRKAFRDGRWKGTTAVAEFPIFDATENGRPYRQFTMGRQFETALGIKFSQNTGFGWSHYIHNAWWRWRMTGRNHQFGDGWTSGVEDMGEVVIFRDLPSAGKIKFYNSTTESAGAINVRGIVNAAKLFTLAGALRIEGENMAMPTVSGTSTTSATTFDSGLSLYAIVKPSTNGTISLYHVASDLTETLIGIYEPGELTPGWRRYRMASWHGEDSVLVKAKLRHVTLVADNDPVVPDNDEALSYGLQAKNYDDKHDDTRADLYWGKFFAALNSELRQNQGDLPLAMSIRAGEGFGTIRQRQ